MEVDRKGQPIGINLRLRFGFQRARAPCHPERSEGSVSLGLEMLRGVYTERSECAQHDRVVLLPRHRHLKAFHLLSPHSI